MLISRRSASADRAPGTALELIGIWFFISMDAAPEIGPDDLVGRSLTYSRLRKAMEQRYKAEARSQKPGGKSLAIGPSIKFLMKEVGMEPERQKARTFQDLIVWRKAHEFVLGVYRITASFPKDEIYGLTQQMRRAAVSIPANIAEGFVRRSKADKVKFMNIAEGSLEESRYYLVLSQDLGYGQTSQLKKSINEVSRLLSAYQRAIRS